MSTKDWNDPLVSFTNKESSSEDFLVHTTEEQPTTNKYGLEEKRIIGGSSDQFHLAPYKYPWALEMYKNSRKNEWEPNQIPMGQDRHDYEHTLTPDERHIYTTVFATLTTSDLAVNFNIVTAVYETITAPEVQLYLTRQISEEGNHSNSYQHVIENLGLDQNEIYSLYKRIPEIKQRFDLAAEYSILIKNRTDFREVVKGLVYYYAAFEGILFYHGFSPIFSLGRRSPPLMYGSYQQLSYIQRDEAMHVAAGIKILRTIFQENPGLVLTEKEIYEIFKRAYEAEECYMSYALRKPILGYNKELHMEHFKYLTNRRLNQLGYDPLYPEATNVLPWLDGMIREGAFFEVHPIEYQTNADLKWD